MFRINKYRCGAMCVDDGIYVFHDGSSASVWLWNTQAGAHVGLLYYRDERHANGFSDACTHRPRISQRQINYCTLHVCFRGCSFEFVLCCFEKVGLEFNGLAGNTKRQIITNTQTGAVEVKQIPSRDLRGAVDVAAADVDGDGHLDFYYQEKSGGSVPITGWLLDEAGGSRGTDYTVCYFNCELQV